MWLFDQRLCVWEIYKNKVLENYLYKLTTSDATPHHRLGKRANLNYLCIYLVKYINKAIEIFLSGQHKQKNEL